LVSNLILLFVVDAGRLQRPPFSLEACMNGNVTNLLLAQMLLSSRRPDSVGWQQTGQVRSGPAESDHVRTPKQMPLGIEQRWPDLGSWRPVQPNWSEDSRWPAEDAFEPPPLRMLENWERQRRLMEDQGRRSLYHEGVQRLRGLMEEERGLRQERQEREREDRLRRGESTIG